MLKPPSTHLVTVCTVNPSTITLHPKVSSKQFTHVELEVISMGAKAIYTNLRSKVIHALVLSKDMRIIKGVIHDKREYEKYAHLWQAVNLDEYASKFAITSETYNMQYNMRKISFFDNDKAYEIVCAVGVKYFRIREVLPNGRPGSYVGIDLKEPSISGAFQDTSRRAERHRLTHFRMSYKKGTV